MKDSFNFRVYLILAFVLVILWGIYGNITQSNLIRKSHIVVCGTALEIRVAKGGDYVVYSCNYDSKRYEFMDGVPIKTKRNFEKGENRLLVAMEKGHPVNHVILTEDEDYEKYAIKPEDTINVRCQ